MRKTALLIKSYRELHLGCKCGRPEKKLTTFECFPKQGKPYDCVKVGRVPHFCGIRVEPWN